jgi:hypothetical protein
MIQYSERAARALSRLKRPYNDIDIFVEDTKNKNMWLELLRAALPRHIKLNIINQLGGREKVLIACRLDQREDGRRKLYIVDGDFDFILGLRKPRLKHLYRLNSYCVENILISRSSLEHVGTACKPDWDAGKVRESFGFDGWNKAVRHSLVKLFSVYGIASG